MSEISINRIIIDKGELFIDGTFSVDSDLVPFAKWFFNEDVSAFLADEREDVEKVKDLIGPFESQFVALYEEAKNYVPEEDILLDLDE